MMFYSMNKKLFISFKQFLDQITKDAMLFVCCFAPILCGLLFQFGVPIAEKFLKTQSMNTEILSHYYLLFDLFLAALTPLMFSFVSAMVILGEIDDGVSNYMVVTPLGKSGYLISRLGIPMVISFFATVIVLKVFSLTDISFLMISGISIVVSIIGFIVSMMVVSISTNKVEGMAVVKLSGLIIMGIPIPFSIMGNSQYLVSLLPSFWLSKFTLESSPIYFILSILVSIVWIRILLKKFMRKFI